MLRAINMAANAAMRKPMDGTLETPVVVLPERQFSFPGPDSGTQNLMMLERIDLLQWRELTLRVRVHSHTLAGSSNTISVSVLPQSWTEEDPGLIFLGATAAGSVTMGTSTPSPALLTASIATLGANAIAALGALQVTGVRVGAGTMNATLSIDICHKHA